jgi:hypothetical protein
MLTWPDSPTRHPSEQPQRSEEQLTGRLTLSLGNVHREAQHASLVRFYGFLMPHLLEHPTCNKGTGSFGVSNPDPKSKILPYPDKKHQYFVPIYLQDLESCLKKFPEPDPNR